MGNDPRDAENRRGAMPPEEESTVTTATATAPPEVAPPEARPEVAPAETPLGEPGLTALRREREARADAEKRAKDAEDALRQSQAQPPAPPESKPEPSGKSEAAEESSGQVAVATTKLRKANLLVALTEKGVSGQSAKAAVRLLDAVAYDENDEPINLDDRLEAAKAQFGAGLFTPPPPAEAPAPSEAAPSLPETHAGVRTPAQPNEDELMAGYIAAHFPHDGEETTP